MISSRLLAALALSLLLAACTAPATRVVLLPQDDGSASAVIVSANGGQETLNRPYARATAARGATGAPVVDQADPAKVAAENRSLFELRPPSPQRYTVFFDLGGTALAGDSQSTLTEALAAALTRSGGEIVVTGHTDTVGSIEQNDDLSRRRAQQVRQMLADRGFPIARILAIGRGERELSVQTSDETVEPRNRRVTIEVR
ncbi:OmpA family protein [Variovorax sp. LT1R16]|uniref:OmpA family protein n=1 Tax=Variovorax sp. LT1R16 TaxID=3443728 RepID=UPI003F46598B